MLKQRGILRRMSKNGNCVDNAVMESFFRAHKSEFYYTKRFAYAKDLIKSNPQIIAIKLQAREAGENEDDINSDLHILQNKFELTAISVYYNALIFSQLYQVKVKNGSHTLLSLAYLAKQRNRRQSFVSYHDKGN